MKRLFVRYGDYLLFVALLLIKLSLFGFATDTYFGVNLFLVSLGSTLLISCLTLIYPPHIRRWILIVISILITFLIASNIWYYRYFEDLLSVALLIQLPQMGDVGGGLNDLIYIWDFLLFLDAIVLIVIAFIDRKRTFGEYKKRSKWKAVAIAGTTGFVLFMTPLMINAADRDEWLLQESLSKMRNYYKLGMFGHHAMDIASEADDRWVGSNDLTEGERTDILDFFDREKPESDVSVEGKPNVIVIQLESFQSSVIEKEIDGQVITPHLNEIKEEMMYFTNFYHQTHQGRTSDAEFLVNTSFYPLRAGSVYTRYPEHSYDSLPEKMDQNGYETAAFHAFTPDFWNRNEIYDNFGFDHFYSIDDFPEGDIIGLTLNDRDFFLTGVEKMKEMSEPYYAFMVALTSHTPYDFPNDKKVLDLGSLEEEIIQNYYHNIHFVDDAFGDMVDKLKEEEMWDESLIVVYGDHDSGLDDPGRDMAESVNAESAVDYFELEKKVPLLIKPPNYDKGEVVEKSGGQIDIAPTILSMLGIEPDFMMGNTLLNDRSNLTVFRDGSFVFEGKYFQSDLTSESGKGTCYSIETEERLSTAECAPNMEEAALQLRLSDIIIKKNAVGQLEENE